jgi:hypothetical protein
VSTAEIALLNKAELDEAQHKAVLTWIDDVIVPALVKRFIREKIPLLKEEPTEKQL